MIIVLCLLGLVLFMAMALCRRCAIAHPCVVQKVFAVLCSLPFLLVGLGREIIGS